jgi:hypothetical protein
MEGLRIRIKEKEHENLELKRKSILPSIFKHSPRNSSRKHIFEISIQFLFKNYPNYY